MVAVTKRDALARVEVLERRLLDADLRQLQCEAYQRESEAARVEYEKKIHAIQQSAVRLQRIVDALLLCIDRLKGER